MFGRWRSRPIEKWVVDAFSVLAGELPSYDTYSREDAAGKLIQRVCKERKLSKKELFRAKRLSYHYVDLISRGKLI